MPQSLIEGSIALATGEIGLSATEHYIPTIGQCSLGQREEGVAPHDDCVPRGEGLKPLEVVGQPIQQFIVESYAAVLCHSCYYIYSHTSLTP